jgi:diacylglycerol kinase
MYVKEPEGEVVPPIAAFPLKARIIILFLIISCLGVLPSEVLNRAKISVEG